MHAADRYRGHHLHGSTIFTAGWVSPSKRSPTYSPPPSGRQSNKRSPRSAKSNHTSQHFRQHAHHRPFSIILGFNGGLMALNDRLKLRSLVAAEKGDRVYLASEEAAIRVIEPDPDRLWYPSGGKAVIVTLDSMQEGEAHGHQLPVSAL